MLAILLFAAKQVKQSNLEHAGLDRPVRTTTTCSIICQTEIVPGVDTRVEGLQLISKTKGPGKIR